MTGKARDLMQLNSAVDRVMLSGPQYVGLLILEDHNSIALHRGCSRVPTEPLFAVFLV